MTAGTFLVALTLVVLVLLLWHLRWVLLVLFGAVVVAVALDVLLDQVQKLSLIHISEPRDRSVSRMPSSA